MLQLCTNFFTVHFFKYVYSERGVPCSNSTAPFHDVLRYLPTYLSFPFSLWQTQHTIATVAFRLSRLISMMFTSVQTYPTHLSVLRQKWFPMLAGSTNVNRHRTNEKESCSKAPDRFSNGMYIRYWPSSVIGVILCNCFPISDTSLYNWANRTTSYIQRTLWTN